MSDALETIHDQPSDFRPIAGPVSGGEMLDEVLNRKFERKREESGAKPSAEATASAPASPDYSAEMKKLQEQLDQANRANQELRGLYERVNGQVSAFASQQQQSQEQKQPELPTLNYDMMDPDLAAAVKTLEQRFETKLGQYHQSLSQAQATQIRNQEFQRYRDALGKVQADFPEFASAPEHRDIVEKFASQFYTDPRWSGLNWEQELRNAARATVGYEKLAAEKAELQKKLEQYEKRQERERVAQKQNLKQVPGIGRGGATASGNRLIGDDILSAAREKGKRLSFSEFGAEFRRRRALQA